MLSILMDKVGSEVTRPWGYRSGVLAATTVAAVKAAGGLGIGGLGIDGLRIQGLGIGDSRPGGALVDGFDGVTPAVGTSIFGTSIFGPATLCATAFGTDAFGTPFVGIAPRPAGGNAQASVVAVAAGATAVEAPMPAHRHLSSGSVRDPLPD
ncbi:conserved hypothetical protein [Frankia canadensis]|uniref:Uncharacterized protein n=1 Tax=Frankia canadensis TaxID=1836972 RepID=A0A2I2KK44_9ACTN|nr:hypothetical protein [Frankia canadensis]SNQ46038.1 conserved hypothetical protein [Frankia canadensis]SOU53328.1 conserved hypothetical protein [Frankia canadensis]